MPKVPNVVTPIPGPRSKELIDQRNKYVPPGVYLVQPITIKESHGAVMTDVDGNTLIDFTSGIGVTSLGHCTEEIVDTICDQAHKLIHSCIHVANYEPYVALAKRLTEITPGWPLLLAPAALVSGDSPAGYQLWSWLWLVLCDALVWLWLRRRRFKSTNYEEL